MSESKGQAVSSAYQCNLMRGIMLAVLGLLFSQTNCVAAPDDFNKYILRAVDELTKGFPGQGYNIKRAYTHNIPYGGGTIKATNPPETMCVAAVAEVIATAINVYSAEAGDKKPYNHLPVAGWNSMRPTDIRSHIWVDPKLDSYGTADALVTFGVGKRTKLAELTPGSFVNINRNNKTGHAVVFIAFLDQNGKELPNNPAPTLDHIAGFKYFSAQNRNSHGLGYGYAFFSNKDGKSYCPSLPGSLQPDCGVIYSAGQKLLNTGYMLHPTHWDIQARDRNLEALVEGLYVQTRSRGPSALDVSPDLSFEDFKKALDAKDTMVLNPIFENDQN